MAPMASGQRFAALGDFHFRDLEMTPQRYPRSRSLRISESLLQVPISVPKLNICLFLTV